MPSPTTNRNVCGPRAAIVSTTALKSPVAGSRSVATVPPPVRYVDAESMYAGSAVGRSAMLLRAVQPVDADIRPECE
jgi:hypothetical protein